MYNTYTPASHRCQSCNLYAVPATLTFHLNLRKSVPTIMARHLCPACFNAVQACGLKAVRASYFRSMHLPYPTTAAQLRALVAV